MSHRASSAGVALRLGGSGLVSWVDCSACHVWALLMGALWFSVGVGGLVVAQFDLKCWETCAKRDDVDEKQIRAYLVTTKGLQRWVGVG